MDPLCTNKFTQEKCQRRMKFCCSGGKTEISIPLFCIRSGDEWLVEMKGYTSLKANVGVNPFLPPATGWSFYNWKTKDFEEDSSLICSLMPSTSPPCCLTVTLSGAAKETQGDCEGEYKSTGLISMGRKVYIIQNKFLKDLLYSFLQVFKLEGSDDHNLFVRPGWVS